MTDDSALDGAFGDVELLRRFRDLIEACPPDGPACFRFVFAPPDATASLAVVAGSFNPLTNAHLALAEAAERDGLGPVAFALSTRTVDKERPEGALLEDRLLVLAMHVQRTIGRGVAVLNRGLYVDQAELFRSARPGLGRLTFLVGWDKIVQIFDPRYYDDRERSLAVLFSRASFAVAPRAGAGWAELAALLARPENRPFAGSVRPIDLAPDLARVSSSAVREAIGGGLPPGGLPPETVAFIRATGCYGLPRAGADGGLIESYAERRARLIAGGA